MTIFRSNYFHLKLSFFKFFLNIRYIYANVFKIFKFELNPLDNKKRYRPLCTFQNIFRTFQVNFQDISVTPALAGKHCTCWQIVLQSLNNSTMCQLHPYMILQYTSLAIKCLPYLRTCFHLQSVNLKTIEKSL